MFSENIKKARKCFRNKIHENEMGTRKDHYNKPISLTYHSQPFKALDHNSTTMTLIAIVNDKTRRRRGSIGQSKRATGRSHSHLCRSIKRDLWNNASIKFSLVITLMASICPQPYNCDIIKTSPGELDTSNSNSKMRTPSISQNAQSSASSIPKSQKENLLASLANNIELQHFRLAPIKSIVNQRPSKFDSASDGLIDGLTKDSMKATEQSLNNHQVSKGGTLKNVKAPVKKSEDSMRQIMQMHEIASAHSMPNKHPLKPSKVESSNDAYSGSSSVNDLNKLQSIVKSPSQLINKVLQRRPLASILPTFHRYESEGPLNLSSLVRSSSIFSGRANYGTNIRPSFSADHNSKQHSGKLIISKDIRPQAYILAPLNDESVQADLESHSTKKDSVGPIKASTKPNRSELDPTESIKGAEGSKSRLGSWLKMSQAKPLRTSFVQDSLRDLITLSQLPIMSNGPVSTAPSIYEKGGKFWFDDKQDNPSRLSGNRTRALDEILRFIYLLSTSSRRKRDPLEAMSSQQPTLVSTLVSQAGNVMRQKPFKFKEGPKSDRKLTDWIKASGSSLMTKDAMPRGVMWDMATDPSLAVTVFHLLERASIALPLGKQ